MVLDDLLKIAVEMRASDLLIKAGSPPYVRVNGDLAPLEIPVLTAADARDLSCSTLADEQITQMEANFEVDAAYEIPGIARFRIGVYRQRGTMRSAIRVVPDRIPSMESLRLPPVSKYFAERPCGLIIVAGISGSGKSTTIAAMVDYINQAFPVHILTIENAIEFAYLRGTALVDQREIGRDAISAVSAIESAMRQDVDVIAAGELSSSEMAALCLNAAETGHLVFAAMQAASAVHALERMIEWFPSTQQNTVRAQLADNLVGVVSQSLIKTRDGMDRAACFETLVGVPSVRNLIREGKNSQIHALIEAGQKQGMMTRDQALANLVKRGAIRYQQAIEQAANIADFDLLCGGNPAHSNTSAAER